MRTEAAGTSGQLGMGLEPLALSTMYAQRFLGAPQTDLAPFFEAGRRMGFERFELSHILGDEAVELVVAQRPRIDIVHHPCPAGVQIGVGDELTAYDAGSRLRAANALVRSIETAARVGAGFVVLHLGQVPDPDGEIARLRFELTARFHSGRIEGEHAERARGRLRERLIEAMPTALDRAGDALRAPMDRAGSLGIRLGVETGYHPHELPDPKGLRKLLDQTDAAIVGAWLDTGHVAARAAVGMTDESEWWASAGDRWLGAHLHDAVGLRDHLAPGAGTIDFAAILAALPATAALSCEFDWYLDPTEVEAGARCLLDAMPTRDGQA